MPQIPLGVALAVINSESYALRFEKFCNALVSALEGGRLVSSTSPTYDRGRDGRTIDPGGEITVCCSLVDDVGEKVRGDLAKVVKYGTPPRKLYFCSSQSISEDLRIKLEEEIRKILPAGVSVETFGARQLGEAAVQRYPEILERHYRTELADTLTALAGTEGSGGEEALHLALAAAGHENSTEIRASIYRNALLQVLGDSATRNPAECARDLAALLHLSRSIPEGVVREHLAPMADAGELAETKGRYSITDRGGAVLQDRSRAAAAHVLEGRSAVRRQVESELGYRLDEEHFSRIWTGFQDRTTVFFFTRGQAMVAALASLLDEHHQARIPDIPDLSGFVRELAAGASATAADPKQAEEIRVAVSDVFSERTGPGFDWLVATAAAFLAVCSLGLEATSGDQIQRAIAKMALILDTDVLLSFLCEGEPEHRSVAEVVRRWKLIGGELLLAEPVLREAAHHAWIANVDFREVETWLPGSEHDQLFLIQNAFVRAFAALMARRVARTKGLWPKFIGQFRGASSTDTSVLKQHLRGVLPFGDVPGVTTGARDLRDEVAEFLIGSREDEAKTEREAKIIRDKAERDADLYVSIVEHARRLRAADPAATCLLLTSSGRLKTLEREFDEERHEELVLSIPVVLHLLSLVPGVTLGVDAMRALLFEHRLGVQNSDVLRVALRALKESQEHSLPWAKRTLLESEIRSRIVSFAKAETSRRSDRADREVELREAFLGGKEKEATATILSEALAAVGSDSRAERELADAKARIRELEQELASRLKQSPPKLR